MVVINFKVLGGRLNIDVTAAENLPNNSPVLLIFTEEGNLSKHEILKKIYEYLVQVGFEWLRPFKILTAEWIVDLNQLRHNFVCLENFTYLRGKITVEPEVFNNKEVDISTGREIIKFTSARFSIYPEEVKLIAKPYDLAIESELADSLDKFKMDFPDYTKCCFLMMKFENSNIQSKIVTVLKAEFQKRNLKLLRADDKAYSEDLFLNIKTYMNGCSFGIALFERILSNDFNPNVSLEVGYMMALRKPILLLKDSTLQSLQTDLIGRLYYSFDVQNEKKAISVILDKWLKEKAIIP